MSHFEEIITDLGKIMDIPLKADSHDSCRLDFEESELSIQIDLDESGEQLLIGTVLGELIPGSYMDQVFTVALRVNSLSNHPRGTLAYSDRLSSLILFEFLPIAHTSPDQLNDFLQLMNLHALAWKEALKGQTLPQIEGESSTTGSGMFGLQ